MRSEWRKDEREDYINVMWVIRDEHEDGLRTQENWGRKLLRLAWQSNVLFMVEYFRVLFSL